MQINCHIGLMERINIRILLMWISILYYNVIDCTSETQKIRIFETDTGNYYYESFNCI
jgi:hypothetical protein